MNFRRKLWCKELEVPYQQVYCIVHEIVVKNGSIKHLKATNPIFDIRKEVYGRNLSWEEIYILTNTSKVSRRKMVKEFSKKELLELYK